ncbi:CbrC family protein [Streptomyces sp. NPDC090045]|uniref:CbrC family protein n=1 Tax=Streptomyces sp. NPDC090045 TaxID=3365927 RepID=UPI0038265B83
MLGHAGDRADGCGVGLTCGNAPLQLSRSAGREESTRRTSGFHAWQDPHRLVHHQDAAAFVGEVGYTEPATHPEALDRHLLRRPSRLRRRILPGEPGHGALDGPAVLAALRLGRRLRYHPDLANMPNETACWVNEVEVRPWRLTFGDKGNEPLALGTEQPPPRVPRTGGGEDATLE